MKISKYLVVVFGGVMLASSLFFFQKRSETFLKKDIVFNNNSFTAVVADAMTMSQYTTIRSVSPGVSISTTNVMLDVEDYYKINFPNVPSHTITYDSVALTNAITYVPNFPLVATFKVLVNDSYNNLANISATDRGYPSGNAISMPRPTGLTLLESNVDGNFITSIRLEVDGVGGYVVTNYYHSSCVLYLDGPTVSGWFFILLSRVTDSTYGFSGNPIMHDVQAVDHPHAAKRQFVITSDNCPVDVPYEVYGKVFYVH